MNSFLLISVCISIAFPISDVQSKTVFHEFHVSYTGGAPDGVFKENILSVNGQFPGPTIEAEVGDQIHVVVYNEIQDGQNVSIHWHGIEQKGTPLEDGASLLTQCPLKYGHSQMYSFRVNQAGTYWYHSHVKSQYTEGLWGPLIVRHPSDLDTFVGEILLSLSDWYHRSAHDNEYWYISALSSGVPPYPDSALINGLGQYPCDYAQKRSFGRNCSGEIQQRYVYRVQPNATYRVRVLNTAATSVFRFSIDDHKLRVIEVDGIDVLEGIEVDEVIMSPGERYSFSVVMDMDPLNGQYLIRAELQTNYLGPFPQENVTPFPEALRPNVTAVLKYRDEGDGHWPQVTTEIYNYTQSLAPNRRQEREIVTLDPNLLRAADGAIVPRIYDKQFTLVAKTASDPHGIWRATFNGSWFSLPEFPLLMTVMDGQPIPAGVMPHFIELGDVVEIVINNEMGGPHPFHLHGHHFWVLGTGASGDGDYDPSQHDLNFDVVKRDTVFVQALSWGVIRFVADNPGVWNFHCHFDWHNLSGMAATFIEAPEILQQNYTYTPDA